MVVSIDRSVPRPNAQILSEIAQGITDIDELNSFLSKFAGISAAGLTIADKSIFTPQFLDATFDTLEKHQPAQLRALAQTGPTPSVISALLPQFAQRQIKKQQGPGDFTIDFGLGITEDPTGELAAAFAEARPPKIGGERILNTATGEVSGQPGQTISVDTSLGAGAAIPSISQEVFTQPSSEVQSVLNAAFGAAGSSQKAPGVGPTAIPGGAVSPAANFQAGISGEQGGVMATAPALQEISSIEDITRFLPGGGGGGNIGLQIQQLLQELQGGGPGTTDPSLLLQPQVATTVPTPAGATAVTPQVVPQAIRPRGRGISQEDLFQDLLDEIRAPSATEEVQRRIEEEGLEQVLGDIQRSTRQAIGEQEATFAERGLLGPGRTSDIVETALAQTRAGGVRAGAGARTQLQLARLAREKEREQRAEEAFAQRFGLGAQRAAQERGIEAQREALGTELGFRGAESAAERVQRGQIAFAELTSAEKRNSFNTIINAMLRGEELSSAEQQFLAKMRFEREENEKDRELKRLLGQDRPDILGDIQQGLDIGTDIASIVAAFV